MRMLPHILKFKKIILFRSSRDILTIKVHDLLRKTWFSIFFFYSRWNHWLYHHTEYCWSILASFNLMYFLIIIGRSWLGKENPPVCHDSQDGNQLLLHISKNGFMSSTFRLSVSWCVHLLTRILSGIWNVGQLVLHLFTLLLLTATMVFAKFSSV